MMTNFYDYFEGELFDLHTRDCDPTDSKSSKLCDYRKHRLVTELRENTITKSSLKALLEEPIMFRNDKPHLCCESILAERKRIMKRLRLKR